MNLALVQRVADAYPEKPNLDSAEWPYSRAELDAQINAWHEVFSSLLAPAREPWWLGRRYWRDIRGQVRRFPGAKPLLHKGGKS